MERNISVIKDVNGHQIVIVNDIRFKGKRNIDWDEVEQYLKQYVGEFIEIAESKEIVYIGSEHADCVGFVGNHAEFFKIAFESMQKGR